MGLGLGYGCGAGRMGETAMEGKWETVEYGNGGGCKVRKEDGERRALKRREERGSYWLVGEEERDAGHTPASWQRA